MNEDSTNCFARRRFLWAAVMLADVLATAGCSPSREGADDRPSVRRRVEQIKEFRKRSVPPGKPKK